MTDGRPTVSDAMLHGPKLFEPAVTAAELRHFFDDDHVHAAIVVADGRLVTVVVRSDLAGVPDDTPAAKLGMLTARTVSPEEDLERVRQWMLAVRTRRLAVVDAHRRLVGLLCLKRTGLGFCSDEDVAARAADGLGERRDDGCMP